MDDAGNEQALDQVHQRAAEAEQRAERAEADAAALQSTLVIVGHNFAMPSHIAGCKPCQNLRRMLNASR